MCVRKCIAIILFLSFSWPVFAQRTETVLTFDDKINHIYFEFENDIFLQSDHYYTGGLALFYTNRKLKKTPAQLILQSGNYRKDYYSGFGIEQRLFTPYSISNPDSQGTDRPYSAYLMLSNFSLMVNTDKHLKISNEIGVGVLGPAAKGMEFQSYIHELTHSVMPVGWENQLKNSPVFDYQFRIEKGLFGPYFSNHIIAIGETRIGTLKDELAGGFLIKFGNSNKMLEYKKAFVDIKGHLVWDLVIEGKFKFILYDATLQGGITDRESEYSLSFSETDKFQFAYRSGVNMYYKRFYARYMIFVNTKDFLNGRYHRYACIVVGFSF